MRYPVRSYMAAALILLLGQGRGAAGEIAPGDIGKAVLELGDGDYRAREHASEFLWKAGSAAEPALRKARASHDPEVAWRAKAIIGKFDEGIYPDTPTNVLAAIGQYKAGRQQQACTNLVCLGMPGVRALLALRRSAPDEVRGMIEGVLADSEATLVPALLAQGESGLIESILKSGAATGRYDSIRMYAAWLLLRGRLKMRMAQLETASEPNVWLQLAYLHRADGDLTNAIECAGRLSDETLARNLRYESGEWTVLADDAWCREGLERLGFRAAFHRLSGQREAFDADLQAIRAYAALPSVPDQAENVVEAFLVNDRPQDAVDYLVRAGKCAKAFELLVAQGRFEEALHVADRAREEKSTDLQSLERERVKLLQKLGEKEEARKIVMRVVAGDAPGTKACDVPSRIELGMNAGMIEEAAEWAASALDELPADKHEERQSVLRELFPEFAARADAWLALLREEGSQTKPAEQLVRLHGYLTGRAWALREFTALADRAAPTMQKLPASEQELLWQSLADAYGLLSERDRAAACERKACELSGGATNYMRLAYKLASASNWLECAAAARKSCEAHPEPASLWVSGWAAAKAGDEKAGRTAMEHADLLALADDEERFQLARCAGILGDGEAVLRQWTIMARVGPFHSSAVWWSWFPLGDAAFQAGDLAAAELLRERGRVETLFLDTYQYGVGNYLESAAACGRYAVQAALSRGRVAEALDRIRVMREAKPLEPDLAIEFIPLLEQAGRKDAADNLFESTFESLAEVCGRFPRFAEGHNAIAWLAARTHRELPAGLDHARKAVDLEPDAHGWRDTLAEVLFQLGRRDEAVAEMQKCVELAPARRYYQSQLKRMREGEPSTAPAWP